MARLTVVSYDGHALQSTDLVSYFIKKHSPRTLAKTGISVVPRSGTTPEIPYYERSHISFSVQVTIKDCTDLEDHVDALVEIFDPYDVANPPRKLIVEDEDDVCWFRFAKATGFKEAIVGSEGVINISMVSADPEWLSEIFQSDSLAIAASPTYHLLTLAGNRPAEPRITFTPTANKSDVDDFGFKRLVIIRNRTDRRLHQYPLEITGGWNTVVPIDAGKMQALGQDLRVYVNDREVDRWIDAIYTDHTKVWINMNLPPRAEAILNGNIVAGDSRVPVYSRRTVGRFPSARGYLLVDTEIMFYQGARAPEEGDTVPDDPVGFNGRRFIRVQRGCLGTVAAGHADGATIYWLPAIVYIYYGMPALAAPYVDNDYTPAIDLTSTNAIWTWSSFGDNKEERSARWRKKQYGVLNRLVRIRPYTGNHGVQASPWTEMGLRLRKNVPQPPGVFSFDWIFDSQIEMSQITPVYDHQEDNAGDQFVIQCDDWVEEEGWDLVWSATLSGTITPAWSGAVAPGAQAFRTDALKTRLRITSWRKGDATGNCYVEFDSVVIDFKANMYPYVDMQAEETNPYNLDPVVENLSTDQGIEIDLHSVLNYDLEVDCARKTVLYREDDSSRLECIERYRGVVRFPWLQLSPKHSNLVANWGFEYWRQTVLPRDWTVYTAGAAGTRSNNREDTPEFVWERDHALRIEITGIGNAEYHGVTQTIDAALLVPGSDYILEVFIKNPTAIVLGNIEVYANGAATGNQFAIQENTAHPAYTKHTVPFTMNAADATLTVRARIIGTAAGCTGIVYIDKIILKPAVGKVNAIRYTEAGVAGVTLDFEWYNRLAT